ncbi:MAG: respiratory nitrate reductase subunit gamma [Spirochaetes bacterium]|nr:respiratory nitrate reductase subunit gamma [Spirochaetota bacterium]
MLGYISYFILVPMVYIAFATLILGLLYKLYVIFKAPAPPGTGAIFPKKGSKVFGLLYEALIVPNAYNKQKSFWFVIILFHFFFLLLFLGHLELIGDFAFIQIIPHKIFLGGGVVGIVLMITTLYFLFRRFGTPYREISIPEDFVILLVLFFCILFGSILHLAERYSDWGAVLKVDVNDYRQWLQSMIMLKPELSYKITELSHFTILVLHVLFANIFLMMFPFSKMVHSVFTFLAHYRKRK